MVASNKKPTHYDAGGNIIVSGQGLTYFEAIVNLFLNNILKRSTSYFGYIFHNTKLFHTKITECRMACNSFSKWSS